MPAGDPIGIRVQVAGEDLPRLVDVADWPAAYAWLASDEFLALIEQIDYVSIGARSREPLSAREN